MSNQPPAHVADERAAFEAWAKKEYGDGPELEFNGLRYAYSHVQKSWSTWQAARAAIPAGTDVASIDTPEFRRLLTGVESARWGDCEPARQRLIAHINAWCRIAAGAPAETPKPFAGPGAWFSVDILGNPMREYALGKWENCTWPSAQPAPAPATDARDALDAARYHWLRDPSGQKAAWQLEAMDKKIDAAMLSANSPREAG